MEKDQIIYDKRKVMGENIRRLRTAQGWEQEQLAQIVGITTSNVRSVEAGKYAVNIDVLNKIAGALGAELRMIEK
jgi:transcriptional regulator with XRE-family HTH domain